jgi:hypothetical protein
MPDPLIVPFGAGKSAAHGQIIRALLALCHAGESYDVRKMVVSHRRDHLRRLRVWRGGHDNA